MEYVINKQHGGFSLSHAAILHYAKLKGIELYWVAEDSSKLVHYYTSPGMEDDSYFYDRDIQRNDPILLQVVKEMGDAANGDYAKLRIVEVPDDVEVEVEEYDGMEWLAEAHRTWN